MAFEDFSPLISIVIPVYNGENYLAEAINSALSQTYENIEVIVINDGSSDKGKTQEIALSYGKKIRYFEKENGGVSTALNLGIRQMKGEYFSWLSHDDLYVAEKIMTQVERLRAKQNRVQVVYSDSYSFAGRDIQNKKVICAKKPTKKSILYMIAFDNSLHGCSLLIPRVAFEQCGVFNESLKFCQDYEMWFRLGKRFPFIYIPKPLVYGRCHTAQTGSQNRGSAHEEVDMQRAAFFKELLPRDFGCLGPSIPCNRLIAPFGFATKRGYRTLRAEIAQRSPLWGAALRAFFFPAHCYYKSKPYLRALLRRVVSS